jgi:hypothetical protein
MASVGPSHYVVVVLHVGEPLTLSLFYSVGLILVELGLMFDLA